MAGLSTNEVRNPDNISLASLGDITGLVKASQEQKAANIHGAGASAAGKDGTGFDKGLKGIDPLNAALRSGNLLRGNAEAADSARSASPSSRLGGDYQLLDLSSPQGLQHLSAIGWGSTAASLPFAKAGLNCQSALNFDP